MRKILRAEFFGRPTVKVARELLGKYLVRRYRGREYAHMITEVEAYDGWSDRASHAFRGKTKRNAPMFGAPGHWYVYFTYGMHWMLNVVTREAGYPAAILIRGLEKISGPARLTKRLGIGRALNGRLAVRKSCLWLEDRGVKISSRRIRRGPRIGIGYAAEWAKKPWRFYLK